MNAPPSFAIKIALIFAEHIINNSWTGQQRSRKANCFTSTAKLFTETALSQPAFYKMKTFAIILVIGVVSALMITSTEAQKVCYLLFR